MYLVGFCGGPFPTRNQKTLRGYWYVVCTFIQYVCNLNIFNIFFNILEMKQREKYLKLFRLLVCFAYPCNSCKSYLSNRKALVCRNGTVLEHFEICCAMGYKCNNMVCNYGDIYRMLPRIANNGAMKFASIPLTWSILFFFS